MANRVSAKIKRTLKAAGIVGVAGFAAMLVARPFVHLGESDAPLDPLPPIYMDAEAEGSAQNGGYVSDSEQEDRITRPVERLVAVASGDTLADVLLRAGVEASDAIQSVEALKSLFNPRALKAGQKVTVTFDKPPHGFGQGDFQQMSLFSDPLRQVISRRDGGAFKGVETKRQVTRQMTHYSGQIKSSLFESAQSAGLPVPVIIAMIKALSYDVDFQRDIQSGDSFEVLFEADYDSKGKLVRNGDMLFASITLSGRPIAMYRHETEGGTVEYFNEKGESIRKALLKTPVDGAKITSGFGMRNHPILGFTKMHKGVDFGVPVGTPIQAAGDGVVEIAGFNGSYGNYVRLRHSNGYGTAYAHMSRIAQGMKPGRHIGQGQIIGFVGSTGRSSGPHLHYEVLQGSSQVNPLSIKMPTNVKLAGREADRFKATRHETDAVMAKTPLSARLSSGAAKPAALTN